MCVCVCVRACVRACVRVCVRACVRACVHACVNVALEIVKPDFHLVCDLCRLVFTCIKVETTLSSITTDNGSELP